ncbi:hypothetical protein JI435_404970 [Parastagonospora nodorum SN15]|uniref:Uncharacterized protein n=1 Tax=Phaeosphaeria nodorum (strain SN15 / ATCC MYA-4574 / FGSC 10173) TaxID=321614 RepID=A0A7U2HXH7_PHANO|nr:hypothetical protein JI435_404970 [Parastagonospora nodorum SN15]
MTGHHLTRRRPLPQCVRVSGKHRAEVMSRLDCVQVGLGGPRTANSDWEVNG